MSDPSRLIAALADVERHVSSNGWDQPARLFALVSTTDLLAREPQLKDRVPHGADDALSAVEQDGFAGGDDVIERLSTIYWPASVEGVALAMERWLLPSQYESELPDNDQQAAAFVAAHKQRLDVRFVVGVTRDGSQHGLARLKSQPDDLIGAHDLVPGLAAALAATLEDPT